TGDSYVLVPQPDVWGPRRLELRLPQRATDPIKMRLDALGMEFEAHESDLQGHAAPDGDAISYARRRGTSFWAGVPGGVEEWILLEDGVSDFQVPVASWIVSGATLVSRGPAVIVYHEGRPRVRVTADAAFGPDGNALGTRLDVVGDRID